MDRNAFLDQVRKAVAEGNRAGGAPPLPVRANLGYQGAGADPVQWFLDALRAAGGNGHLAANNSEAAEIVLKLVATKAPRRVLLGRGSALDELKLEGSLRERGVEVIHADRANPRLWRESFFAADIGISAVHYLIAETGTMVMAARIDDPRSLSLLPPVHIAVAESSQLLPDLFDLYARIEEMPSKLTLITGPSKTGDIELKLVTGVHGPGEVHVVLINS